MIDIGSVSAGIASLKAAKDIAEGLMDLRDTAKFQGAVVELQGKILAAQTDQFALLERVRELEKEMAELEAWEAEKERYELTDFGSGTFAYALKPDEENGEPLHSICAACYQKGHKSILQNLGRRATGQDKHRCPACGQDFMLGQYNPQSQRRVISRGVNSW